MYGSYSPRQYNPDQVIATGYAGSNPAALTFSHNNKPKNNEHTK